MNILQKTLKNRALLFTIITATILCAISLGLYEHNYHQVSDKLNVLDKEIFVYCKIESFPKAQNVNTSFCARIKECSDKAFVGEGVYVVIKDLKKELQKGDYVKFKALLSAPDSASNEGAFDYRNYLKSLDVSAICYPKVEDVKITKSNSFLKEIYEIRNDFIENCYKYIYKSGAGLVSAVLTGDRTGLGGEVSDSFKLAGIYHIVAISGLHLNLFIFAICDTISKSRMTRKKKAFWSFAGCVVIGFFVMVFTGFGISVVRAFVMMLILFSGLLVPRESDSKNSLFVTGFVIIFFMPYTVYSVSWWLSFLSTLGVIDGVRFTNRIKGNEHLSKIASNFFLETFIISAFTSVYTLPVTAVVFGYLPLYSWIANAFVLPVMSIFMALGVVFAFSCAFLPLIFPVMLGFALTSMGEYICFVAKTIAYLPFATIATYPDTIWHLLCLSVCAYCLFSMLRKRQYIRIGLFMLSLVVALTAFLMYNNVHKEMKITFADSGQGDCTLLEINGYNIMIDCGTQDEMGFALSSLDTMLRAKNIRKLDALFITHYHTDHTNGALYLLEQGKAENLVLPLYYDLREVEARKIRDGLLKMAVKTDTKIHYVSAGSKIDLGDDASLEILLPNDEMFFENNDMSLVSKITYGKTKALFLGDAEDYGQKYAMQKDIDCDILKLAHHGGHCDMSESTIKKASPSVAVASCGKYNNYGHPDKRVLDFLEKLGCEVYRTDKNGAVTIRADKNAKFKITTVR